MVETSSSCWNQVSAFPEPGFSCTLPPAPTREIREKRCHLKPHQQCFQGFAKSTVVTNRIAVPSSQRQGTATPSSTSFSHQTPSIAFAFADCKGSNRSHLLNHWSSEYVNLQYLASEALMGQWQSKQNDRRYIQRGDVYDTPST